MDCSTARNVLQCRKFKDRQMIQVRHVAVALSVAMGMLAATEVSLAQTPAEFYQGKNVSLLVGFGPGGEDDLWARTVSRHLTNHIPGNPNVVPVHAPGSGGLLVVNRLYNTAAKDGTVIGMINRGIPFEPLLGGQAPSSTRSGSTISAAPAATPRSAPRARMRQYSRCRIFTARSSPSAAPARAPTPRSIRISSRRCSG
jgi:hypothetical protein